MWKSVVEHDNSAAKVGSAQHSTREPDADVEQPELPNSTSLEDLLNLTDPTKCEEMLASLYRSDQLGEHANQALIAVHKARIHCWDNSMKRYIDEFVEKVATDKNSWLDAKNTENIARRFNIAMKKRMQLSEEEREETAQVFYKKWHSEHQECSQFHRCRLGYCQRCKKVQKDDTPAETTHIVCRHHWPWCRKLCLYCSKPHSLLNSDLCKPCVEANNECLPCEKRDWLPYDVVSPARVENSTRFDKHGQFRMAPAHVIGPCNNPSINTHNRDHTLINDGNTDLKHPTNPGAVRIYMIGYLF